MSVGHLLQVCVTDEQSAVPGPQREMRGCSAWCVQLAVYSANLPVVQCDVPPRNAWDALVSLRQTCSCLNI